LFPVVMQLEIESSGMVGSQLTMSVQASTRAFRGDTVVQSAAGSSQQSVKQRVALRRSETPSGYCSTHVVEQLSSSSAQAAVQAKMLAQSVFERHASSSAQQLSVAQVS
jgi:hypothetical protein